MRSRFRFAGPNIRTAPQTGAQPELRTSRGAGDGAAMAFVAAAESNHRETPARRRQSSLPQRRTDTRIVAGCAIAIDSKHKEALWMFVLR